MKQFSILLLFASQSLLAQYNFSKLDVALENAHHNLSKNMVTLVYKDGKLVYKKEEGNFTIDTQEPIASCSKWLTTALVMTYIDEGKLSLDDKVSQYLPLFRTNGKENITIRQCLSHQTGIHQEPVKLYKLLTQKKYKTLEDEVNDFATARNLDFDSGSGFYYGTAGINIAARVVEVIAKKDFIYLMESRIFKPLEMIHSSFKNNGAPNPSGGGVSSAGDYMNFLIMLLNKGEFKGQRILSEKAVHTMQTTQTTLNKIRYAPKAAKGMNYAIGSWIQETDLKGNPTVLSCPGLFGTWPMVDNCRGYACVFFVKSLLGEQKAATYVSIKKSIDEIFSKKCN